MQQTFTDGDGDAMQREVALNGVLKAMIGCAKDAAIQDDESARLARELESAVNALEHALLDKIADVRAKAKPLIERAMVQKHSQRKVA